MPNTNIIWGILYSCGLIAIGAFGTWLTMRDSYYEPCWAGFSDVFWESQYQQTLDDPWDFEDPDMYSNFCVRTQHDDREWRSMTQVEAHEVIWENHLEDNAEEDAAEEID